MGSDTRLMGWLASRKDEAWRNERVIPICMAPVEVQFMGSGTLDVLHARNVSATGLGLDVPHEFDLAKEFELVVTLPGKKPFLTSGVIKHVTESEDEAHHFGLEFTGLEDSHRRALEEYVRSRMG